MSLSAAVIYTTAEETTAPAASEKEITLKTDTYWVEERDNEVVRTRGETNLPAGTLLQMELKAGINLFNQENKQQLLDVAQVMVNNDGQYTFSFTNFMSPFAPEYYEITTSIAPESKEMLLSGGFTENIIARVKDYHMLNIFSPKIPARRRQSATALVELIAEISQLNQELMTKTMTIEKIKQGDSEIEKTLKEAFGLKNKRELLDELGREWFSWEPKWNKMIDAVSQQARDDKVCLSTAADIYQISYQISNYYKKYRQEALDDNGQLKETSLSAYLSNPPFGPVDVKKQLTQELENELAVKINHDITAHVEEIVNTYQKCRENPSMAREIWANFKTPVTDYLNNLKEEMADYFKANLFLEVANDEKKKEEIYNQLRDLITLTTDIMENFGLRLSDPENKKLESITRERLDLINRKTSTLFER